MSAPWGAPQPGPPPPGAVPPAPAPAVPPEQAARLAARGRRAVLLGVAGAFATLPLAPLGLLLGLLALIDGIGVLRTAGRWRLPSRAGVVAVWLGPLVMLVAGALTTVQLVFEEEVRRYQDCMAGANTRTSSAACEDAFREDVLARFGIA